MGLIMQENGTLMLRIGERQFDHEDLSRWRVGDFEGFDLRGSEVMELVRQLSALGMEYCWSLEQRQPPPAIQAEHWNRFEVVKDHTIAGYLQVWNQPDPRGKRLLKEAFSGDMIARYMDHPVVLNRGDDQKVAGAVTFLTRNDWGLYLVAQIRCESTWKEVLRRELTTLCWMGTMDRFTVFPDGVKGISAFSLLAVELF